MKNPKLFSALFACLFLISLAACRGEQGEPGDAYLAFTWELDMPNNVSHGNPYVPASGNWSRYYPTQPGVYTLYYEGVFWNGNYNQYYAWNTTYEIYVNEGGRGKPFNIQGEQGSDSYLTLVLAPFGPYEKRVDKRAALPDGMTLVYEDENRVEILIRGDAHSLRAIYRKVAACETADTHSEDFQH